MIDFGKMGLESNSYSLGMIMFRVLYQVMGESDFNKCIRTYYADYYAHGATTNQFVDRAIKASNPGVSKFFDDWMYSTKYIEWIKSGITIDEMTKMYRLE